MTQLTRAAALLTFCLALASCGEPQKIAVAIPTPPERLICEAAGDRPTIPPEHSIDWPRVATVEQARAEHTRYVAAIRDREGVVTSYLLGIEGKLFTCWANVEWRRNFEQGLPR